MDKAGSFMLLGLFIMVFSFAIVSADTLVGGKIYTNNYGDVVSGAYVTVTCGTGAGAVQTTESLNDGTYAITFDTASCYAADKVSVTAEKGNLYGEEPDSKINNSTEEEGEFVAVANVNIKTKENTDTNTDNQNSGSGSHTTVTYLCGNGICNSGETPSTCSIDCLVLPETETPTGLIDLGYNPDNSLTGEETQNSQNNQNAAGITGAVTGTSGFRSNAWLILLIAVLLLIIAIVIIALVKRSKKNKAQ